MKNLPLRWLFFNNILILVLLTGLSSCDNTGKVSEQLLTDQEKQVEKQRIIQTLNKYNQGANERKWDLMVETLANEIVFFGTDKGESAKNFQEFKLTIQKQWNEYEILYYGDFDSTDAFISIDDYARYANAIYGSIVIYGKKDNPDTLYTVTQRTLRKDVQKDIWEIQSGILAVLR